MGKISSLFVVCFVALAASTNAQAPSLALSNSIKGRLLTPQEGCGYTDKIATSKIVGGINAKPGAFPWMALLGFGSFKTNKVSFDCGGSLITSRHVLTAAHCIAPDLIIARLGEHDFTTTSDGDHIDARVKSMKMHPGYDEKLIQNDIALLFLEKDVPFSDRVRPVCLPMTAPNLNRNFVGYNPFVAGWGNLHEDGQQSHVLQMLQVPVIENDVCESKYKKQTRVVPGQYDKRVMCAGFLEGGKDSCQGDSGGPLMLPLFENGKFPVYQIGVVSYGIGCARSETPGVYTRVQTYMDWIQKEIKN